VPEGGGRRPKKVDEKRQRAFEAFLILKEAGYEPEEMHKTLKELVELGFLYAEVPPPETISDWYCGIILEIENSPASEGDVLPEVLRGGH